MSQKDAIMDRDSQLLLLAHAREEGLNTFVPVWLMLHLGMHPHDLRKPLEYSNGTLKWSRAKTSRNRKEAIPNDVAHDLSVWLAEGKRYTREGYAKMVRRLGAKQGHPDWTPMTLRHTACIEFLRKYHDIDMVAVRMGCDRLIVATDYLILDQWEKVGAEK